MAHPSVFEGATLWEKAQTFASRKFIKHTNPIPFATQVLEKQKELVHYFLCHLPNTTGLIHIPQKCYK